MTVNIRSTSLARMMLMTLIAGLPSFLFCSYFIFRSWSCCMAVKTANVSSAFIFLLAN
jgi:hypothetical protein